MSQPKAVVISQVSTTCFNISPQALGTLYMFHKSVPPIHCWNFEEKCYKPVTDRKV